MAFIQSMQVSTDDRDALLALAREDDGLGRIVEMAHQWLFKSETYDNCNCAVNCGCQFNLPSTHGYCQSAFVGKIVEGHFNDTPLAGLNWAALYKWPGEIKDENGKRQIVIDERADEAQRSEWGSDSNFAGQLAAARGSARNRAREFGI